MTKIRLKIDCSDELRNIPGLTSTVELSNIVNCFMSCSSDILRIVDTLDSPSKIRDILRGLVNFASYLYEGTKRGFSILERILGNTLGTRLVAHSKEIEWLRNEVKQKDSFRNTILKDIRNKLGFHFGQTFSIEDIISSVSEYPPIVLIGDSERKVDCVYPIADGIITKRLAQYARGDGNFHEKLVALSKELVEYANRFELLVEHIVTDLFGDYVEYDDKE